MSVSPFRAVVKVKEPREEESDDEIQRYEADNRPRSSMSEAKRREQSPIKEDSQIIRGSREEYLNSFNRSRQPGLPPTSSSHRNT